LWRKGQLIVVVAGGEINFKTWSIYNLISENKSGEFAESITRKKEVRGWGLNRGGESEQNRLMRLLGDFSFQYSIAKKAE
jgi:hypothetical protein